MKVHDCPQPISTDFNHDNDAGHHGRAITRIVQGSDGRWWADNDEYSTPIYYCPFCGLRLTMETPTDGK